jgi:hypothetical protein
MLNFRVDNKLAIVTGCSKGIGMAIAIELANSGADIIGVSGSMPASGSDVEKAVLAAGKKFYPYQADFSNRDSVYAFLQKVVTDHPKIDILINNAGNIQRSPAAEHPDEFWDNIIDMTEDLRPRSFSDMCKRNTNPEEDYKELQSLMDKKGWDIQSIKNLFSPEVDRLCGYNIKNLVKGKTTEQFQRIINNLPYCTN